VYSICCVAAPAEWIAPELIGKDSSPKITSQEIYYPNGYFDPITHYFGSSLSYEEDAIISNNTLIGVVTKQNLSTVLWDSSWEDAVSNCG
jgi:hypothetical protein